MPVYIHHAILANNENHPGLFREDTPKPPLDTDWRFVNCPVCAKLYEQQVMSGHASGGELRNR